MQATYTATQIVEARKIVRDALGYLTLLANRICNHSGASAPAASNRPPTRR
jgi:hypothetical protein